MAVLFLYLGLTLFGYIVGSKLRKSGKKLRWIGIVQFIAISALVFVMGSRIGANKEIIKSLDSIGVTALIITALVFVGSVGAVFITRKLLGFDKKGVKTDD
ncbi:MAG: LysO family transporter [Anaerovoracaceae bacterium]